MKASRNGRYMWAALILAVAALLVPAQGLAQGQGSAPVRVVNGPENPVPARDADHAARNAFLIALGGSLAPGEVWKSLPYGDTIPEGYRFVVETVGAAASSPEGQQLRVILEHGLRVGDQVLDAYTEYFPVRIARDGVAGWAIHQPTRLYIDKWGPNALLFSRVGGDSESALISLYLIGYLVKLQ